MMRRLLVLVVLLVGAAVGTARAQTTTTAAPTTTTVTTTTTTSTVPVTISDVVGHVVRSWKQPGLVKVAAELDIGTVQNYGTNGIVLSAKVLAQVGLRTVFVAVPVNLRTSAGVTRADWCTFDPVNTSIRCYKNGSTEVSGSDLGTHDVITVLLLGV